MSRKWAIRGTILILLTVVIVLGIASATISSKRQVETLAQGMGTFCGFAVTGLWAAYLIPVIQKRKNEPRA